MAGFDQERFNRTGCLKFTTSSRKSNAVEIISELKL